MKFQRCVNSDSAVLAICLALTGFCVSGQVTDVLWAAEGRKPNIIIVLADDLGWAELGCYGNRFNETRSIDSLAKRGIRCTQAYAAAPVCSPYRAALLSGQHPARTGILDYLRPNSANALSTELTTLPEHLKSAGYATGMIGKWHLTGYDYHEAEYEVKPRDHGFDWDFAREVKGVGNGANFWPYVFRTQPIRWLDIPQRKLGESEFLVDRMNQEAVEFVERNKDRPFFLLLSHYATHSILNGKPELVAKYRRKHPPGKSTRTRCYLCEDQGHKGDALNHWAADHNPHLAAMLESIDDGVGMLSRKLEELGLSQDTIFIFTSDNGGETNVTSNAPLRGGKSQLYEGGIRIPLVVSWPKKLPQDVQSQAPTVNTDFLPTLLEATQLSDSTKSPLDGLSMLGAWSGKSRPAARSIYWHYPLDRPHFLGGRSAGAVRNANWKLIQFWDDKSNELYDLSKDPGEKVNLAAKHPEIVTRLDQELSEWQQRVSARHPSPPMLVEPQRLYFADHFSSGRASERWFFNSNWDVRHDHLHAEAKGSTRLFIKKPQYKNVMIRFDFRLGSAEELRLVTGEGGRYNAVLHVLPDHFYIKTAIDRSVPYFPFQHGECAFRFERNRWYSMTVEFWDDQMIAHVTRDHVVHARHPMIDREREYLAFQVDRGSASLDNVQVLQVRQRRDFEKQIQAVKALNGKYPVQRPEKERIEIRRRNLHETLYQGDPKYRSLVLEVERLDEKNTKQFPQVFTTHKAFQKKQLTRRKQLQETNDRYRALRARMNKARQAARRYVEMKRPELLKLPAGKRRFAEAKATEQLAADPELKKLLQEATLSEQTLEREFADVFVSNEDYSKRRNAERKKLNSDPTFRAAVDDRAAAWRKQQEYLDQRLQKNNAPEN